MKIIVDIGHARDTGARGNGLEEHAVSEGISKELVRELREAGYEVVELDFPHLSNAKDLEATIKEANRLRDGIGISLHCDSASHWVGEGKESHEEANPKPHGGHVCYYPGSSNGRKLAEAVGARLGSLLPGRAEVVVGRKDLAVLRRTRPVWVLCECGFITNPGDAEMMRKHPEKIARAISEGVKDYLKYGRV